MGGIVNGGRYLGRRELSVMIFRLGIEMGALHLLIRAGLKKILLGLKGTAPF